VTGEEITFSGRFSDRSISELISRTMIHTRSFWTLLDATGNIERTPNQQEIGKRKQKGGLPLLKILAHRTRRQGAPLLTRSRVPLLAGWPVASRERLRCDGTSLDSGNPARMIRRTTMSIMTKTLNTADLAQIHCSENWYRHAINRAVLFTDGAKYVADLAGAYWLLDEIAIIQAAQCGRRRRSFSRSGSSR